MKKLLFLASNIRIEESASTPALQTSRRRGQLTLSNPTIKAWINPLAKALAKDPVAIAKAAQQARTSRQTLSHPSPKAQKGKTTKTTITQTRGGTHLQHTLNLRLDEKETTPSITGFEISPLIKVLSTPTHHYTKRHLLTHHDRHVISRPETKQKKAWWARKLSKMNTAVASSSPSEGESNTFKSTQGNEYARSADGELYRVLPDGKKSRATIRRENRARATSRRRARYWRDRREGEERRSVEGMGRIRRLMDEETGVGLLEARR